jgi:hypothetical protein
MYKDITNVEYEITITPVITGATGITTNGLKKNLKSYQENTQYILYKTARLETSNIIRKVQQYMQPEQRGSPLVQMQKCQGEKTYTRHNNNNNNTHFNSELEVSSIQTWRFTPKIKTP